jgi:hypothetical protein
MKVKMSEWVEGKAKTSQLRHPIDVSKYKYLLPYRYKYLLKNEYFMLLTGQRSLL